MKTCTIDYCTSCSDGASLLDGLCWNCRPKDRQKTIASKTIIDIERLKQRYQDNENLDGGWSKEEASDIREQARQILFALFQ